MTPQETADRRKRVQFFLSLLFCGFWVSLGLFLYYGLSPASGFGWFVKVVTKPNPKYVAPVTASVTESVSNGPGPAPGPPPPKEPETVKVVEPAEGFDTMWIIFGGVLGAIVFVAVAGLLFSRYRKTSAPAPEASTRPSLQEESPKFSFVWRMASPNRMGLTNRHHKAILSLLDETRTPEQRQKVIGYLNGFDNQKGAVQHREKTYIASVRRGFRYSVVLENHADLVKAMRTRLWIANKSPKESLETISGVIEKYTGDIWNHEAVANHLQKYLGTEQRNPAERENGHAGTDV